MTSHRRVPQQDQKNLSNESRIESILKFGDLSEIITLIKKDLSLVQTTFIERTKKDLLIPDKRKQFLNYLFQLAQEKYAHSTK